jgi:hypothetical protein
MEQPAVWFGDLPAGLQEAPHTGVIVIIAVWTHQWFVLL